MKKFFIIINILVLLLIVGGCESIDVKPTSIEIVKDSYNIDELDVLVGDKVKLDTTINNDLKLDLVWESSNPSIVNVNTNGELDVKASGMVVINVKIKDYPFISDSIIVEASTKVEQTGIGSGMSEDDPIYLGNEGEDEPLEIYFIEMQHIYADSIFIKKGNVDILIDSGYAYDGTFVNKVLTEHCADGRLDLLMLSHSDGDHIDGLPYSLEAIDDISLMVDYGGSGDNHVGQIRSKYKAKGMKYYSAYDSVHGLNGASDLYYLTDDFYFEVLNTGNYVTNDRSGAGNGNSVAVIFHYKEFTFFTAGDLTTSSEESLMRLEDLPEVTLYKASHHGSNGSNSQTLLDTLNPKAVAISCARQNYYNAEPGKPNKNDTYNLNGIAGHPYEGAISRIYKAPNISQNLNVYWSAVNGTMKFTTYGQNDFVFTGSPTIKGYYDLTKTGGKAVWNEELQDFENKVTGEENLRLHETKIFEFRGYIKYLPA